MTSEFIVKDCSLLAIATGLRAYSLSELADKLASVDIDSIYYHFWGSLLRPSFDDPDFRNDFSAWIYRNLNDPVLAERLGVIVPTDFDDFEQLRESLIETIEDRINEDEMANIRRGIDPFQFLRFQIVIFDTGSRLSNPSDIVPLARNMSIGSYYYHFIDSRRRLEEEKDDFSEWMSGFDGKYKDCIDALRDLDPYFFNLQELRNIVSGIFENHLRDGDK